MSSVWTYIHIRKSEIAIDAACFRSSDKTKAVWRLAKFDSSNFLLVKGKMYHRQVDIDKQIGFNLSNGSRPRLLAKISTRLRANFDAATCFLPLSSLFCRPLNLLAAVIYPLRIFLLRTPAMIYNRGRFCELFAPRKSRGFLYPPMRHPRIRRHSNRLKKKRWAASRK